ncbi:TonB-dependent receptor plug domain-containing protein, partial [Rheinheimera baltica]
MATKKISMLGSQALMTAFAFNLMAPAIAETTEHCNANSQACTDEAIELIKVHGVRTSVYSVKQSGDVRRLAELVDTPATITVLTKDQIEESGKSDLKDILAAQAGVTLGTGENGNAFGDRYIIRGHEARSDVFVDGLRDPG